MASESLIDSQTGHGDGTRPMNAADLAGQERRGWLDWHFRCPQNCTPLETWWVPTLSRVLQATPASQNVTKRETAPVSGGSQVVCFKRGISGKVTE